MTDWTKISKEFIKLFFCFLNESVNLNMENYNSTLIVFFVMEAFAWPYLRGVILVSLLTKIKNPSKQASLVIAPQLKELLLICL